jgi:hypothetical protein
MAARHFRATLIRAGLLPHTCGSSAALPAALARRRRTETQELRLERERLQLAYVLRRELGALAGGAGDLARSAQGQGRAAEAASARLSARRRRAADAVIQAARFGLDLGVAELDASDREALGLADA